jgi:allantoin racemase
MKILLINPNTTPTFTKAAQEAVDKYKNVGTEVLAVNPTTGPGTIESIFEEMLSGMATLEVFLAHEAEYDGFIIACYGNESLVQAAREVTRKPVIGITEASYYMACMLGRKFSVVTTGDRWESLLWDSVRLQGLENRCASIRPTSIPTSELEASGDEVVRQHLLKEARKALEIDGAEVILLGCAGLTGFDKELEAELGVPVIDGVVAALKLMEGLLGYGVGTSKRKSYLPLDLVDLHNLPPIFSKAYDNH